MKNPDVIFKIILNFRFGWAYTQCLKMLSFFTKLPIVHSRMICTDTGETKAGFLG